MPDQPAALDGPIERPAPSRLALLTARIRLAPESPVPVYAGLVVAAVGFVLIGLAWSHTAALASVALQIPYLISEGLTGIGLVLAGLCLANAGARRRETAAQERQLELLAGILRQVADGVVDAVAAQTVAAQTAREQPTPPRRLRASR